LIHRGRHGLAGQRLLLLQRLLVLYLVARDDFEYRFTCGKYNISVPPKVGSFNCSTLNRGPRRQLPVTTKRASHESVVLRAAGEVS
jgi:hypothetical protein